MGLRQHQPVASNEFRRRQGAEPPHRFRGEVRANGISGDISLGLAAGVAAAGSRDGLDRGGSSRSSVSKNDVAVARRVGAALVAAAVARVIPAAPAIGSTSVSSCSHCIWRLRGGIVAAGLGGFASRPGGLRFAGSNRDQVHDSGCSLSDVRLITTRGPTAGCTMRRRGSAPNNIARSRRLFQNRSWHPQSFVLGTDRIWMRGLPARATRRTGWMASCSRVSTTSAPARAAEDRRIVDFVDGLDDGPHRRTIKYRRVSSPENSSSNWRGAGALVQPSDPPPWACARFINWLVGEAPELDLLIFQRQSVKSAA